MMTALRISVGRQSAAAFPRLRLSAYDRVASLLLALLVVAGSVVLCLSAIWLGMQGLFPPYKSVPVHLVQPEGAGEQAGNGEELRLESPIAHEVAAESDLTDLEFKSTLETVIDVAALRQVADDEATANDENCADGEPALGDSPKGPGQGNGKPDVPLHLRWEINFGAGDTLGTYARKLDSLGIELGVVGVPDAGQVTYIKHLARDVPEVTVGAKKDEKRLYMTWRSGGLKDADRDLAAKAGIPMAKTILQFFSDEMEQDLLRKERDFRGRDVSTILKTRFGLRPLGKGYEFYVIEQRYR